jgi:hypothetical protein
MGLQSRDEKADQAAKRALDKDISTAERHPPDDLTDRKQLIEEDFKKRDQKTEKRKE